MSLIRFGFDKKKKLFFQLRSIWQKENQKVLGKATIVELMLNLALFLAYDSDKIPLGNITTSVSQNLARLSKFARKQFPAFYLCICNAITDEL